MGAKSFFAVKWDELADQIMEKKYMYTNEFVNLSVEGHNCVVADLDPKKGSFTDTPSLSRGELLRKLHHKTRGQYNALLGKLNTSGSHSNAGALIKEAYEWSGEKRTKDVGTFYYWLVLRNKDLKFLQSTLMDDENGDKVHAEDEGPKEEKAASDYSKRQLKLKEKEDLEREMKDEKQIKLFRSVFTPESESSNSRDLNASLVQRNNAQAATERTKDKVLQIDMLMAILKNPDSKEVYSDEDFASIRKKIRILSGVCDL